MGLYVRYFSGGMFLFIVWSFFWGFRVEVGGSVVFFVLFRFVVFEVLECLLF